MTARSQAKRKTGKTKARRPAVATRRKRAKAANLRLMREAQTPRHTKKAAETARQHGKRTGLPDFIKPCLATLVEKAPSSDNWIHEIKFDGYRIQARLENGKVKLLTRKGLDWTGKFPTVAAAVAKLRADTALIDGELVSEDAQGISRFSLLQQDLKQGRHDRMVLYAFDLMHLDGADLKPVALSERKTALAKLFGRGRKRGVLRFSKSRPSRAPPCSSTPARWGSKASSRRWPTAPTAPAAATTGSRPNAPTGRNSWLPALRPQARMPTRSARWCLASMTAASCNMPAAPAPASPMTSPARFIASSTPMRARRRRSIPRRRKSAACASRSGSSPRRWSKSISTAGPKATACARLRSRACARTSRPRTWCGSVRKPPPSPKERDERGSRTRTRATVGKVTLTHPDRVYWDDAGVTKQDLADYYGKVWKWMRPHVTGRPLALVRCPEGAGGQCFFQKHAHTGIPTEFLHLVPEKGDKIISIDNLDGLIALVQGGALEIHVRGATVDDRERADRLVFDLDPGPGPGWAEVVEAAREVRERLKRVKLKSFVKTTGGKGLHVVVPIKPAPWDTAKEFAHAVAESMAKDDPERYLATATKARRKNRIFVDYLRNSREATAVAPYSTAPAPARRWRCRSPGPSSAA